jgi:excisionase family DNA binding protein
MTRLLTLPEAAKTIGLPVTTFYKIINAGHGPVLHPDCNRPRRVSEQNLQEWVDKREAA